MKQLLILSGKGGTGKTTTAAAFLRFSQARAFADCDVDAPNLHLLAQPDCPPAETDFFGSDKARIRPDACSGCGACAGACRFGAILPEGTRFQVSQYACEGCGVCALVCPNGAVELAADRAGRLAVYDNGQRVFATAELRMGRGNSGKLVTEVKSAMRRSAGQAELAVIDGSPGIGCPVIASVSGVDLVLLVTEPSRSGLSDLTRIVQTAVSLGAPVCVCINKYDISPEHTQHIEAFCREHSIPVVGHVPYDPCVARAINDGKSVAELDCPARQALLAAYRQTMQLLARL